MKTYGILGILALLVTVIALPIYAIREPLRMAQATEALQARYVADAATLYLDNCALCHGPDGRGLGAIPPLRDPALAEADRDALYDTIAHSIHGSAMASWHVNEGGTLSSYQVESLVTLINGGTWSVVTAMAEQANVIAQEPIPAIDLTALEPADDEDPHECRSCHEEPRVHAERFGLNCARCHNLQAWKPALLTRHTFRLDHGIDQQIACQTCHADNYATHTCFGCHDHQPEEVQDVHTAEGMLDIDACVSCHPTGEPGEARSLRAGTPASETAEIDPDTTGELHGN